MLLETYRSRSIDETEAIRCLGFDLNIGYDNGLELAFKENNNCN